MKCKIPNQDAGSAYIYIDEAMADFYDQPGKEVYTDDSGTRYLDVKEDVAKVLITNHDYEEYKDNEYDYTK